jgi:hypothetical protein
MGEVRHITPDSGARQYLASLGEAQATCMSQGHSWPKIRPGKALPKGVDAVPQRMGAFQVRETCPVCRTIRTWTTLPGGAFDMDVQYRYEHPQDWVTKHGDVDVTRRDIKADVWGQFGTALKAAKSAS